MNEGPTSTGQSCDSATLHVGESVEQVEDLLSIEEQRATLEAVYELPDRSDWVTCLPGCQWEHDGSAPASGGGTPPAIHATKGIVDSLISVLCAGTLEECERTTGASSTTRRWRRSGCEQSNRSRRARRPPGWAGDWPPGACPGGRSTPG